MLLLEIYLLNKQRKIRKETKLKKKGKKIQIRQGAAEENVRLCEKNHQFLNDLYF